MKKILLFPLMLLLAVTSLSGQTDLTEKQVYGVAFYNLENLFDTINANGKYDLEFSPAGARKWDSRKYWSKINNLAGCILSMATENTPDGPAIIGVAEVENRDVLEDLVNAGGLRNRGLRIVHHDSPDRRGVDVSLLYNPRLFTVIDVTNHTLVIPDNPDFRTRDQMCVTGILGGDTLSVIVNHWPSRLGGQERSSYLREAAGQLSKHIADSLWTIRPNQGVIVMGDLNDDPFDHSCAVDLGALPEQDLVPPHGFFNPWWRVLDGGKGTLAYKGRWNLFDQIIVSGTLLRHNDAPLQYSSCRINDFDFLKNTEEPYRGYPKRTYASGNWLNGYSDHFPTIIFLYKAK
ncbi:MAG: endonuclease/exonuclease/phosphatase family protein [Bacteroides sp.]|nr:endonuclease/exonuclease/phosphatase family protein [Bacteroides sp.]